MMKDSKKHLLDCRTHQLHVLISVYYSCLNFDSSFVVDVVVVVVFYLHFDCDDEKKSEVYLSNLYFEVVENKKKKRKG